MEANDFLGGGLGVKGQRSRAQLEVGILHLLWRGGGSEIGGGLEGLLCGFEIVAAPIEGAQHRVGERQLWVELQSGLEFALGTRLIFLRQASPPRAR